MPPKKAHSKHAPEDSKSHGYEFGGPYVALHCFIRLS